MFILRFIPPVFLWLSFFTAFRSLLSPEVRSLKFSFRNFQGCITVYLSRFTFAAIFLSAPLSSSATLIGYHSLFDLSTTFLFFSVSFCCCVLTASATKFSIARSITNVNNYFHFFPIFNLFCAVGFYNIISNHSMSTYFYNFFYSLFPEP